MADKKISQLSDAAALTGGELVELVQGGVNLKTTTQDIANLGGGGGSGTVESVTGNGVNNADPDNPVVQSAAEGNEGTAAIATQTEANTGTDDAKFVTPLKGHVKNRKTVTITGDTLIDQEDHDQCILFANSATAVAITLPSLAAGTYVVVVQMNSGAVSFVASGTTIINATTPAIAASAIGSGIAFFYRSTTEIIAMVGDITNLLTSLSINGELAVKAGASAGIIAKVGGCIFTDTTTVVNTGTGEDTLYSYTVPSSTLNTNKDTIRGFAAGFFAANGNNKNVRLKFGSTTLFATGALAFNTGEWCIHFEIIRTGATTQKCITRWSSNSATLDETCDYSVGAETLSSGVVLTVTGEATANNDIVGEMFKVYWDPHE